MTDDIVDTVYLRRMAVSLALELPRSVLDDVAPRIVAAAAEIERLRRWFRGEFGVACDLTGEIERLRAELSAANADAERLATIARGYVVGHDGYGCTCYWCAALAAHRERISRREEESHAPTATPASPDE